MLKFLIVDDNKETLTLLEIMLAQHGECVTAENGIDAIKKFELALQQKKPFHLVFLDIMMPGKDGHEVLKIIRNLEQEVYPGVHQAKVAMLTALGTPKVRFASFEEGCEYYLVKPIIKAEILNIVEETEEWFSLLSESD